MSYPQSTEDKAASDIFARIEFNAYFFHRERHSYESLKRAGYPNADELEKAYKEMING